MSKYSSFKKQQKLFEGWRKYLKEADAQRVGPKGVLSEEPVRRGGSLGPDAKEFVDGAGQDLEPFVTMLKKIASDPEFRRLAFAGRKDDGGQADEALKVSSGEPVAANQLTPTQMDIDMEKSLGDQMTNKWSPPATESALAQTVTMPSPGGAIPVLTYGNKYILDGHHRWSQVMMTNPGGMMTVQNLSGPALPNAEVALKATQLAIAALAGNVVTKGTKTNLLKMSKEAMGDYVRSNITQEVLDLLVRYSPKNSRFKEGFPAPTDQTKDDKGRNAQSVETAAEYYMGNLGAIQTKTPGKFKRIDAMPQADDSGVPQAQVSTALGRGNVNFDNPQPSDIGMKNPAKKQ